MLLTLLDLLQAQPISKKYIVVAGFLVILAICVLVYFLRKLKSTEKVEEDWSLTRSSLLKGPAARQPEAEIPDITMESGTPAESKQAEPPLRQTRVLSSDVDDITPRRTPPPASPPREGRTLEMAVPPAISGTSGVTESLTGVELEPPARVVEPGPPARNVAPEPAARDIEPQPPVRETAPEPPARIVEPEPPARNERATQLFSSVAPPPNRQTPILPSVPPEPVAEPEKPVASMPPAPPATREMTAFDEEVWAGFEETQETQPPAPPTPPAPPATPVGGATRILHSPAASSNAPQADKPTAPLQTDRSEPPQSARVEQRPQRARFEAPVIKPVQQREVFEPPVIKPLSPREQATLSETKPLSDLSRPSPESNLGPKPVLPPPPMATMPLGADNAPRSHMPEANESPTGQTWDAQPVAPAGRVQSIHKPAGNVLGLPMERSQAPLVLGTPVKPHEEIGIGNLTGYGKVDKEGGRGGLITLLIALAIIGGAVLVYLLVPSVHERVNESIARARGIDQNPEALNKPKAMIFPAYLPDNDKSQVKGTGSVQNISSDTLQNLSLDVQLNGRDGLTQMQKVPVTPTQLAPNDQGNYEIDYDGKQFKSYTIKRLLSDDKEVRFTAPGQK
jgi:hypothetical protein